MKILFYTSDSPSLANRLIISEILSRTVEDEYCFVVVNSKKKAAGRARSRLRNLKRSLRKRFTKPNELLTASRLVRHCVESHIHVEDYERWPRVDVREVNDDASVKAIEKFDADVIIQCGAGILKPCIYEQCRLGTLNMHAGVCPEVRGIHSTLWCLYYGMTDRLGATCHLVDATLDTGNILAQYRYPYTPGERYPDIQSQIIREGANLVIQALERIQLPHEFSERTVVSNYFSTFPTDNYKLLHNHKYEPVEEPDDLKTKTKNKAVWRQTTDRVPSA